MVKRVGIGSVSHQKMRQAAQQLDSQQGVGNGDGNISGPVGFVDQLGPDDTAGTLDDVLTLRPWSPCINQGKTSAVPADVSTDLAGGDRVRQGKVDMGAYEGWSTVQRVDL